MAFSFGFSGDDIDLDREDSLFTAPSDTSTDVASTGNGSATASLADSQARFMGSPIPFASSEYAPQLWSLSALLGRSVGVRMSYTLTPIASTGPGAAVSVPRRDLYDVKHQLMSQDELSASDEILLGLTNEDLRVATYEGGLKSWECTFDLMEVLAERSGSAGRGLPKSVLEMGCGTGLPCVLLLSQMLQDSSSSDARRLVLADYNESVLRLVTVPNLLLAWCEQQPASLLAELQTGGTTEARAGEIEVTQALVDAFLGDLSAKGITVECVSGGWSPQFVSLLLDRYAQAGAPPFELVLASETIYSPETLPLFTDTLLCLLSPPGTTGTKTGQAEALVAAKQMYFGVGGGVPEFEAALDLRGVNHSTVHQVTSQGVSRAILQIVL